MKSMKAMKSMKKAMKAMKRKKAMRVSKVAKARVMNGTKERTVGGLKKSDLTKNKQGKVVSKKSRAAGLRAYQKNGLAKFGKAVQAARKALGVKGFVPVGGKTAKGQALLKKARSLYKR